MSVKQRTRAYNVAKHLTIEEAVNVCREAREAVDLFDEMVDNPTGATVNRFKVHMGALRELLRPEGSA